MGTKDKKSTKGGMAGAIDSINKIYGEGTINKSKDMNLNVEKFPSGSLKLDLALGGGYPLGRIIEIYGPESSGKTTLTLHAIAEAQKLGKNVAFIDVEHALDPSYADALGVDMDNLYISQPTTAEDVLSVAEALIKSKDCGVIVIDSVAAMKTKKELDGEIGDANMATLARLLSTTLPRLISIAQENNTTIFFINQLRMKIGVVFGNPETTSGGNALKYYASVRIDVRRASTEKNKDGDAIANKTKIKIVKNKVAPPFKIAEVMIAFGEGMVGEYDILELSQTLGFIEKKGSWFYYGTDQLAQGEAKTIQLLKDNPELTEMLAEAIKEQLTEKESVEESTEKKS